MNIFGKVVLSIRGLLVEVPMAYLITALRPGPFADIQAMQPATDMDEIRQMSNSCMLRNLGRSGARLGPNRTKKGRTTKT